MDRSGVKTKQPLVLPNFDGTHELRLGKSFKRDKGSEFHTIRYDFKPASIDHSKEAHLEVIEEKEVNITFPNVENKGTTVFKGVKKPSQKECVLIFDHRTKEFTLERLSANIQVKKQRHEGSSKVQQQQAAKASAAHFNKKTSSSGTTDKTISHSPLKVKEHKTSPVRKENIELSPAPSIESYKPPTPDIVPTSGRKLSKESSTSSMGFMSESSSSESSSNSSSSSGSDSSSDEEPVQEKPKPTPKHKAPSPPKKVKKKPKLEAPPGKPAKTKESRPGHIMSQLSADLQLSESDSD